MPAIIPIAIAVASTAATVYGTVQASKAAKNAAAVDNSVAGYNARLDEAMAAQSDLDTQANIRTEREQNAVYLSKQHASYAAAGVIANSGSALDAQLTNVGRMEQQIQQQWVNNNQNMQRLASSASVGRLEGNARAEADRAQGTIAMINGVSKASSQLFGAYSSGSFSGLFGGGGGGATTIAQGSSF